MVQVVRCCLEHAASVAKTFLTSDAVVVDIKESKPIPSMPRSMPNPMLSPMPGTTSMPMPMPMPPRPRLTPTSGNSFARKLTVR